MKPRPQINIPNISEKKKWSRNQSWRIQKPSDTKVKTTRADCWGCEEQCSLIVEDYITPMGRACGGGGQRIQPASLTSMYVYSTLSASAKFFIQTGWAT